MTPQSHPTKPKACQKGPHGSTGAQASTWRVGGGGGGGGGGGRGSGLGTIGTWKFREEKKKKKKPKKTQPTPINTPIPHFFLLSTSIGPPPESKARKAVSIDGIAPMSGGWQKGVRRSNDGGCGWRGLSGGICRSGPNLFPSLLMWALGLLGNGSKRYEVSKRIGDAEVGVHKAGPEETMRLKALKLQGNSLNVSVSRDGAAGMEKLG